LPYRSWLGVDLDGIIPACLTHAKRLLFGKKNMASEANIRCTSLKNLSSLLLFASYDNIALCAELSQLLFYQCTHKEAREEKSSNVLIFHHYFYCMFSFLFLNRYST